MLLVLAGCSNVRVRPDQLRRTRKVAIVSLGAWFQFTEGGETDTDTVAGSTMAASGLLADVLEHADLRLRAVLGKAGMEAVPEPEVTGNAVYAELCRTAPAAERKAEATMFDYTPLGMLIGAFRDDSKKHEFDGAQMNRPGFLRLDQALLVDAPTRARLQQALGVDAVVFAMVVFKVGDTSGFSVLGVGNREKHPAAVISIAVFQGADQKPIWQDPEAEGPPTKLGVPEASMIGLLRGQELPMDATREALKQSLDPAFDVLLARYRGRME